MRHKLPLAVLLFAALPLLAAEPTPRQRELIERLLTIMQMDKIASSVIDTMFAHVQSQMVQQAEARGTDVGEANELFDDFRARSARVDFAPLIRESLIQIYSRYFTEQELVDLVAFYSTPTGRKTLDVMDDIMRDGMQMGAEKLGPKIDEVMKETIAAHEKKRSTMSDMRTIASALEVYKLENGSYPAGDYASLKETLKEQLSEFPERDSWGHPYTYVLSQEGHKFRLVSAGADPTDEDDIVMADGEFVQPRPRQ